MKTMTYKNLKKQQQDFARVQDADAESMIEMGWKFCPKKCWKRIKREKGLR